MAAGPASEPAGAHVRSPLHGWDIALLTACLLITADFLMTLFRVAAAFHFLCGYLASVSIRIIET